MGEPENKANRKTSAWVTTTYFAEGFPYQVVNGLSDILFKHAGASLSAVGLTALFHLPWNLKFLWAPYLDNYKTKRWWLLWVQAALVVVMLMCGWEAYSICQQVSHPIGAPLESSDILLPISVLFLVMATLAATHDVAIDGYYMEALDQNEQAKYVGFRAAAYRAAIIVGSGPLVILVGWLAESDTATDPTGLAKFDWLIGMVVAAAVMAGLFLFHTRVLPRCEEQGKSLHTMWANGSRQLRSKKMIFVALSASLLVLVEAKLQPFSVGFGFVRSIVSELPGLNRIGASGWISIALVLGLSGLSLWIKRGVKRAIGSGSDYSRAFVDFLAQPRIGMAMAFVVTFRTGESFLGKMKLPFLMDEMGMSQSAYGLTNGTVGMAATIAGTSLAGWLISKHGLKRWLWLFVIGQNVPNLAYMMLASMGSEMAQPFVELVIVVEWFGAGLGTAVLMVYIMRCCDPRHKAAHMAILTAIMSLGYTIAGATSGFLAEALGFAPYFLMTFLVTIPAMVLVPFVPNLGRISNPAG